MVPQIDLFIFLYHTQELEITFANKIRFKTSIKAFVQYVLSLKNNLGKTVRGQVFQFVTRYKRGDIDMVETMPTQETASTSPFSSENSKPQPPRAEVQPQRQPQRSIDETLAQDQISKILTMLDERIVEAMKRELSGERLPVYIVDQDFVTLGWNPKQFQNARTSFKCEIRDATQYEVSLPSRNLGGVVGWVFWIWLQY